jgi:hypothetical protein
MFLLSILSTSTQFQFVGRLGESDYGSPPGSIFQYYLDVVVKPESYRGGSHELHSIF